AGAFMNEIHQFPLIVHLSLESEILGTAGGIAGARAALEPPIVVWNADILAEPPLGDLLRTVQGGGLAFAVAPRAVSEGTVRVDGHGRFVRLRGRTFGDEAFGGDYVGVAALGADVLADLPAEGCLVADVALPRLASAGTVRAVPLRGAWRDVGSLA